MGEGKEYISRPDEMGNIHISEDVLTVIAAAAIREVDGVAGLGGVNSDLNDIVNSKKLSRSIDIQMKESSVAIRVAVQVKYGFVIPEVGRAVQDAVHSAVENTSGLTVEYVNVHVTGISFPK